MRNREERARYRPLVWAIFRRVCWIIPAAAILVWLLRFTTKGSFANGIVDMIQRMLNVDYQQARSIYQLVIRNNLPLLYGVLIFLSALLLFWMALRGMLRYFKAISVGLNQLEAESEQEISLPPELDFLEKKMEHIRLSIKQKELDAKLSEQRKNDLVVYLAHDIKTPLTSVIGYLSLLEEAPDLPPAHRAKYVGITLEKALRLEQLVDEFFDITRFNLQSIVLHIEPVNLTFLLRQMADEAFPLLAADGKRAQVEAADITLHGDPDKLARVFQNIFKNAIAYSSPDSTIHIRAAQDEQAATVEIQNEGPPIPPDMLDKIFEKFYRLDGARSTRTGGAGLGLAIAKEITEAHGGVIRAESSGNGTCFIVRLPLKQQKSSESPKTFIS